MLLFRKAGKILICILKLTIVHNIIDYFRYIENFNDEKVMLIINFYSGLEISLHSELKHFESYTQIRIILSYNFFCLGYGYIRFVFHFVASQ